MRQNETKLIIDGSMTNFIENLETLESEQKLIKSNIENDLIIIEDVVGLLEEFSEKSFSTEIKKIIENAIISLKNEEKEIEELNEYTEAKQEQIKNLLIKLV